jgi:hypothetical protein
VLDRKPLRFLERPDVDDEVIDAFLMLARIIAAAAGVTFYAISGPTVFSKAEAQIDAQLLAAAPAELSSGNETGSRHHGLVRYPDCEIVAVYW